MHRSWIVLALGWWSAAQAAGGPMPLSPAESAAWQDRLVPLPHRVELTARLILPAAEVAVTGPEGRDPLLRQAASELRSCLGLADSKQAAREAKFIIALQILAPGTSDLDRLKNPGQAYRIRPGSEQDPTSLIISAVGPEGLYYGSKTLQQLLRARLRDGRVEMPLARVTDWPDLEDRGLWGADNYDHVVWMADRKMNIIEQISDIGIEENGKPYGRLKKGREAMITEGPQRAVKPVPAILHLEQISGKGVFRTHPELKAVGSEHEGAICYSKPGFVDVLADWIVELRQLPGVEEVDVWMAENMAGKKGCQCPQCRDQDRSVLEARVIAAAFARARQRVGKLRLRILTSEETEKANPEVFRALPPDIRIWYYHSLLTYTAGEEPMVRDYLVRFAREGRWIGMCPNVVSIVHFATPFNSGACFAHYRMNEFVDKGLSGLLGYATPRAYYAFFNVEAAAEWAWNAKGRTPREFSRSWAVRQGLADPALFAEWTETLGPAAWDVYGSDWPNGESREFVRVAGLLKQGKLPALGSVLWGVYRSPWGDIKSSAQLDEDAARADRSLELARRLGRDEFVCESLIIQGYIRSLQALRELGKVVRNGKVAPEDKVAARGWFKQYAEGLQQAADNLPRWEATLPMRKPDEDFTKRPRDTIAQVIGEMRALAAEAGIAEPPGH